VAAVNGLDYQYQVEMVIARLSKVALTLTEEELVLMLAKVLVVFAALSLQ